MAVTLRVVEVNRGAVTWSAGVCGAASGLAVVIATEEGPAWRPVVIVLIILAALTLALLLWTALPPIASWTRQRWPRLQSAADPITDRWRYTTNGVEVPALTRSLDLAFDHPGYLPNAKGRPASLRISVLLPCSPLAEMLDSSTMRDRFNDFLTRPTPNELIAAASPARRVGTWHSRATSRRSHLESDLISPDNYALPVASAILVLPVDGPHPEGADPRFAALTLHIDLVPSAVIRPSDFRPAYLKPRRMPLSLSDWRARIALALKLPAELADFLGNDIGLAASCSPAAQFGLRLQTSTAITELVNPGTIKALPSNYTATEFTGWAVADPAGKSIQDMASTFVLDISERVLHLDGPPAEMAGVASPGPLASQAPVPGIRRQHRRASG